MRIVSALTVLLAVSTTPVQVRTAREQEPYLSFPSVVQAVYLDVAVMTLRTPLTAEDFTVYEDGRLQTLTFFNAKPMPTDVALLLDVSGSMKEVHQQVLLASEMLIGLLDTGDSMEIFEFGDRVELVAPRSADKEFLRSKLQEATPQDHTILWEGMYTVLRHMEKLPVDKAHPRRRVLVLITDGIENGSHISAGEQQNPRRGTLWREVRDSQTSIFAIVTEPAEMMQFHYHDQYREGIYTLTNLCKESGGKLQVATSVHDLSFLMKKVTTQLTSSYTLGWTSNAGEGKPWRHLQVLVRGIPSEKLHFRSGYQVPEN